MIEETRCGACLGHVIACASRVSTAPIRFEDALKGLPKGSPVAKVREIVEEITDKLKQREKILSDSMGMEYAVLPISARSVFKFKGRNRSDLLRPLYKFSMILKDLSTGEIVWSDEQEIRKIGVGR